MIGPGRDGERWHCVQSHYRQEHIASEALAAQGFPVYLPLLERELPDRTRILVPLFSGYLFVRFNREADRWRPIASSNGVRRLFSTTPERPTPVPRGVVEALIAQARPNGAVVAIPHPRATPLPAGAAVKVLVGPLAELRGICEMSAGDRVRLLVAMMGREIRVELNRIDVIEAGLVE